MTVVLLLMASIVVPVAAALFVQFGADDPNAQGNLVVDFGMNDLGANVTTTVTVSADATAVYACRNQGGNFPSDPKKTEVSGPVSSSGEFTSDNGGRIRGGSLTLSPPASTLDCPPGQEEVLASVSYANIQGSEPNSAPTNIDGTRSRTFFEI